ncbi:MAG TPA: YraN family protein [Dehalococcoidia bacterium]|nr:YraN family protein [Dehalococcoidia bacterium]
MTNPRALGAAGERLAAAHLEAKGYRVEARNVRLPEGEIDIVASDGHTRAIVEVRARRGTALGDGLDSVNERKAARLRQLAEAYAASTGYVGDLRIDVIAVDVATDGRLLGLRHLENAVEGDPA